jgi:hypothetical protein
MANFVLSTCMDGIAAWAVSSGVTTRAYGYPASDPIPPCLIVAFPTRLDFDLTFHALGTVGKVEATFPLWFVVGKVVDKSARDALSAIISGATGIKNLMDGSMGGTFLDTARVMDCKIETVQVAAVDYLAAVFDMDVIA